MYNWSFKYVTESGYIGEYIMRALNLASAWEKFNDIMNDLGDKAIGVHCSKLHEN